MLDKRETYFRSSVCFHKWKIDNKDDALRPGFHQQAALQVNATTHLVFIVHFI